MAKLKRAALSSANAVLGRVGLAIQPAFRDFDARLNNPRLLGRMWRQLSDEATRWLETQAFFTPTTFNLENAIAEFYEDYLKSPFRQPFGGSRFNNLVWLFIIARAYSPSVIVDSGTYQGASAWALWKGSSRSKLYSFDIDLSQIKQKVPGQYIEADWTTHEFTEDLSDGLCYFDDHVDQARRLLEASRIGFPLAIFDDDFPVTSFAPMAHGGAALPKVEFCLDDDLRNESELTWIDKGVRYGWPVDRDYLDQARAVIAQSERLPNTSIITGIHQTPYRIVQLNSSL